jgi:hypothetical protein
MGDKHSPPIALDVEECTSLRSLDGTTLNGVEDLRSIETLGELHGRQEGYVSRYERKVEDDSTIEEHLQRMRSNLGHGRFSVELTTESAVLEKTILKRLVRHFKDDRYSTTVLSKVELCATATTCTITQDSHQGWSRSKLSPERTVT